MAEPPPLPERYAAVEALGEGATGEVWRVRDAWLGVDVALKIVFPHLARHARFRARFAREVALSASVVHPRIVPVYDRGALADGRPYVALAYAGGGSLAQLLREGPPLLDVLRIIDQVLDALGALHARGIVHQDLKPANVLLHAHPGGGVDAWVADLGVAGAPGELALAGQRQSGTPAWMAPEQLEGRVQELGPWTDLYAVGLLLYELLGGERIDEDSLRVGRPRRIARPITLPDDPPPALLEIVRNLLHPDPRQRYDRAADVRRALKVAIAGLDPDLAAHDIADWPTATTTFGPGILDEARQTVTAPRQAPSDPAAVPRWNRVPPGVPSRRPPPPLGHAEAAPAGSSLLSLVDPPLVVRGDLRRDLWRLARRVVRTGEPHVALVVGQSGSGKSRVVESVARGLDQGGHMEAVFLRYHSPPGEDDGYRGAVREILAPWSDTREEAERRLARWLARDWQVAPEQVRGEASVLARWCGYVGEGERPVNSGVGLVFLYRHLDARAWRGGACLVLEDVHHATAEGDGLAICEALLERSVGERPVLAMATLTEEALERDPDLARRVADLERLGAVRLAAPRFGASEMLELLCESFRIHPDLALLLVPRCHGSPTFATLLMRDWAARGLLRRDRKGRLVLPDEASLDELVPGSVEELCERRIEGALAGAEGREAVDRALAATALAGTEPPAQVVREVDQEGLDALLATGLVRQAGMRLVFEHGGVAHAARRRALLRPDAAELHRALAEAWEKLGRVTGIDVDLPLGRHRLNAGEPGRAVAPLLRTCRTAIEEDRPGVALDAARLAEVAADRAGVPMAWVEARQHQVEALLSLERVDTARRVLEQTWRMGHVDRLSEARLRALEARAALASGALETAREQLRRASAIFEALRDRAGRVLTAHGQAILHRIEGRPDRAAERYARMVRLNAGQDPRREVLGLVGLAESRLAAGRLEGLDALVARLRAVARESGDTRNIAQAVYTAGLLQLRRRRLDEARRSFETARALAATLGTHRLRIACEHHLGEVLRYRGDLDGAEAAYERAALRGEARGWKAHAAVARLNLALLHVQRGAVMAARTQVDRADRLLQAHPRHWAWLYVGLVRAMWAAEEGDEAACRAWWSVARDRGLGSLRLPDLWLPLERLATAAAERGWGGIARQASGIAADLARSRGEGAEVHVEE